MSAPLDPRVLLGPGLDRARGLLHVAAVWEAPDGRYATLRVGEGALRTASDAVVLSAARARADAIVTTGRILRDEPGLVHASIADAGVTAELEGLRRTVWGLEGPPWIAVLTASGELPEAHPALVHAERLLVLTGKAGAAKLRADATLPPAAEIVAVPEPGPRALVEHLRDVRGCASIVVEAGASTAARLYGGAGGGIDELWLTVCQADDVPAGQLVGPFVERETIEATLGAPVHTERHLDGGVPWATLVYQRGPVV
jgi:riboflavin biosynthesis pyrimidine reductase